MIQSSNHPQIYIQLGMHTDRLGCLMLDTEPIQTHEIILPEALYVDPEMKDYQLGYVSEYVPHVTLLYGFIRSAQEYKPHLEELFSEWKPEPLTIKDVIKFYNTDKGYVTVVAEIMPTPNLLEANALCRLLPHIDTFDQYRPHITLAYLKDTSDYDAIVEQLRGSLQGSVIGARELNYGE